MTPLPGMLVWLGEILSKAFYRPHRDGVATPAGVTATAMHHNPIGYVGAITRPFGPIVAKVGEPTAIAKIRKQLNSLFKKPHKWAIAYVLSTYANERPLETEDIFALLDDIGAASPEIDIPWNEFQRRHPGAADQMVSKVRSQLRQNGIPCN